MTREEAINTLKENYCAMCLLGSQDMESCDIRYCDNKDAIKALEQEPIPKNDLGVEKDKLIADCEKMSFDIDFFNKPLKVVALDAVKNIVKELPSVTPQEPITNFNIPFLMHKEMDIPISECQKAYDIAIGYLRSQAKVKG